MTDFKLNRRRFQDLRISDVQPIDSDTLRIARGILDDVSRNGDESVIAYARRFGELSANDTPLISRERCRRALEELPRSDREVLERTANRIRSFAKAQRDCVRNCDVEINGGRAGHEWVPVDVAGCYAPGGRYPLPSSVLMTVLTAKVAGVREVILASPKPTKHTLAAAAIAEADAVLALGGAHAIGAMAYGLCGVPRGDMIVGPGNRFVTAAKYVVSAATGIDMLTGPSEILVIADDSADPGTIAGDLLAQAEHDVDARVTLIVLNEAMIEQVEREVRSQLVGLSTAEVAIESLKHASVYVADNIDQAVAISDVIAPEHLQLQVRDARCVSKRLRHAGAVFIGSRAAEVFGDYGAGPNHTLPTGGSARYRAGLSVFTFLRARTFIEGAFDDECAYLIQDVAALARMEYLEAHARAAEIRRS